MKTLIFKNGTTVDFVECYSKTEYVQGAQRSVLDFRFDAKDISLNEVDNLFTSDECAKLIIHDNENEFMYDNYSVRVLVSKQKFVVVSEDGEKKEVEQISVKMAQRTHIEIQLAAIGINVE